MHVSDFEAVYNVRQPHMLTGVDVAGFSKVFSSMWGGSLYGRFEASAVFMVLLSLCNRDGVVDMTPEAIAGQTGWPIEIVRKGIAELAAPDPRSRTPDCDGRRILQLDQHRDWGWRVTNYKKYRDEMRSLERREYLRQAKEKQRAREKSSPVNNVNTVNQRQPIAEAEAEAEAIVVGGHRASAKPPVPCLLGTEDNLASIPARAQVSIGGAFELPSEWGSDAEALGWKPKDILKESEKFRQYWVSGKGSGTRRTVKGWRQSWSNWLAKAEKYA